MKFALVDGQKREAEPGLVGGECQECGKPVIAKCGLRRIRIWHWAHKSKGTCNREPETPWHRAWKDQFPAEWQEVICHAEDGERHIADVKTLDGWAIEFQHSNIHPDERRAREAVHQSLVWVVDGKARKRDAGQFLGAFASGESRIRGWPRRRISSPTGALLRDWAGSPVHVVFDFGAAQALWWLFPGSDEKRAYVEQVSRAQFVRSLRATGLDEFDSLVQTFSAFVAEYEPPPSTPRARSKGRPPGPNRYRIIGRRFRL